ncbi:MULTISPECIES: hypothetical protein [unclassified Aeromonas]|uniref:hypothetical protein n=1 Tax=unclassified Aeromonas TaxID=257493 RepID=UPI00084B9622|nr:MULTISPECIES: hypothetical protein [unclassified Aeromonas]OEC41381.1 hypothetical protein A9G06_13785 [Aeromonas sp. DNP9]OEC48743.1 hypothetical protein A9G04_20900 [Aeromonas sp. ANNP30]OEC60784.1 hypothetical protein A9G49_20965 [Aeromonas sp. ANP5]
MTTTEFINALSQRTNIPIITSKDFIFIESSGIKVLEHHHKIAVSVSGNGEQAETRYSDPSNELMQILTQAFEQAAKRHQQRLADERINHMKDMKERKNV